jgi:hypothetical protein
MGGEGAGNDASLFLFFGEAATLVAGDGGGGAIAEVVAGEAVGVVAARGSGGEAGAPGREVWEVVGKDEGGRMKDETAVGSSAALLATEYSVLCTLAGSFDVIRLIARITLACASGLYRGTLTRRTCGRRHAPRDVA